MKTSGRNETRIIRDIGNLLVPSAQGLFSDGHTACRTLTESVDEGWNQTQPITLIRPQPDFSVGFQRSAFDESQMLKIRPFLGDSVTELSHFRTTWYMYFSFLFCEIKQGALDVADRQNAHSAFIAVRAIVYLFQLVLRERELVGKIVAFSISHDDQDVRIWGYYPKFHQGTANTAKPLVTCHRHSFDRFNIVGGRDNGVTNNWTTYKFVSAIYNHWAPTHLQMIRSALDKLPEGINPIIITPPQSTGLSQNISDSHISDYEGAQPEEIGDASGSTFQDVGSHTPETSITHASVSPEVAV